MVGKLLAQIFICSYLIITAFTHGTYAASLSPVASFGSSTDGRNRILVAEMDKPIDTVLETLREFDGNILLLVPTHDFEKRDPPDLGTGRSYSAQRIANVMWGQLASHSPLGPGRRKRSIGSLIKYLKINQSQPKYTKL